MTNNNKTLRVQSSPHIHSGASVEKIMRNVVLALLPTSGFAVYAFGITALLVLFTAILSCVLSEHLLCKFSNKPSTLGDYSVVITGLLYGMTLPPGLPLWMVCVGGVVAVGLGKFIFGGLGYNVFNPALVGRAFLQAAFPVSMTSWMPAFSPDRFHVIASSTLTLPFTTPHYDIIASATPLAAMKFEQHVSDTADLLLGLSSGSTAETCSVLILLGGIYLMARNMLNWRIPAGIFAAVILLSGVFNVIDESRYGAPLFMLFSGGLMLGALFMATDMVASPMTSLGCFIYGVFIGILVVIIRYWSGMTEGVMYAILFANAISPHIDRLVQPLPYGFRKRKTRWNPR